MERRDFVANISLAMAVVCTGGLAACSKGGGNDNPNPNPGGGAKLSVNLDNDLKNVGDFKISNGVILIRVDTGDTPSAFAALTSKCTHEGCTVSTYNATSHNIECNAPCGHGSRYATSGAVVQGPATAALSKFTVTVTGNTLTVS